MRKNKRFALPMLQYFQSLFILPTAAMQKICILLFTLCRCEITFNPKDMSHIEAYLENHTPSRDNYLDFQDGKQFPTGFECTFEEGLCDDWFLVPSQNHKDPITNMTEVYSEWIVLQGPTLRFVVSKGSINSLF